LGLPPALGWNICFCFYDVDGRSDVKELTVALEYSAEPAKRQCTRASDDQKKPVGTGLKSQGDLKQAINVDAGNDHVYEGEQADASIGKYAVLSVRLLLQRS